VLVHQMGDGSYTLTVMNIVPPEPETSGSFAETLINWVHLLDIMHAVPQPAC
jgi:hypothetical protein